MLHILGKLFLIKSDLVAHAQKSSLNKSHLVSNNINKITQVKFPSKKEAKNYFEVLKTMEERKKLTQAHIN